MLSITINPRWLCAQALRSNLDVCFGGGWSEASYEWHHMRSFAGLRPDLLVLLEGEIPVAGTALNYREVRGAGRELRLAILTAAWTLPPARGRGHFTRLTRASFERARDRGCNAVVGFFTVDNASHAGFQKLGAMFVPCRYLTADATSELAAARVPRIERRVAGTVGEVLPERCPADSRCDALRFVYRDFASWESQFLRRPYPTRVLELEGAGAAVVEQAGDTDRLQWLSPSEDPVPATLALARDALARHRRFFTFTSATRVAERLGRAGLLVRPGAMGVLWLTRPPAKLPDRWDIQPGDRM